MSETKGVDSFIIPGPGCYPNISNADYHASAGISKSGLDEIAKSPMHFRSYLCNRREQTAAMRLGSAVHTLVLEPDRFDEEYIRIHSRLTKEGKAAVAANQGKTVLTEDEYAAANNVADAIRSHALASALLDAPGRAESSFYWNHGLGALCKCRPDYLRDDGYIVDLKTTEDASPGAFSRSAEKYRYYVQAAFYRMGVEAVLGTRTQGFVFIAVEKSPPYAAACYLADPDMVGAGELEIARCLGLYKKCVETDTWPGYPEELIPLSRPKWAA